MTAPESYATRRNTGDSPLNSLADRLEPIDGQFPNTVPSAQEGAMQAFRDRAQAATRRHRVGAFPNFVLVPKSGGADSASGTVFVTRAVAEWHDVPLTELKASSDFEGLPDFEGRIRAANAYAANNGFVGAFPNFFHADYGHGVVCGTVLLNAEGAEWRDVPWSELGSPSLADFAARFRATQDYATREGFVGGFPNFFHAETLGPIPLVGRAEKILVCGTVLLKRDLQLITSTNGTKTTQYAELTYR
jgi:hypothetical protein